MSRAARLCLLLALLGARGLAQQWYPMVPQPDAPGVAENPLRGLVPFASEPQGPDSFPHSLEWFYLPLSDVVVARDTYDWAPLERQLAAIAGRGHQTIFRFYLDYPGRPTGIPAYLLRGGLKTWPYTDWDNGRASHPSVLPDYTDPRLIDCLVAFVRALGKKYDGDVRVAYLTAGLYGFWGEWHLYRPSLGGESPELAMAQKDKDAILRAYAESFEQTPVQVRQPGVTADAELLRHFGFHDDSFLNDTMGEEWMFWPLLERARLSTSWERHPIGGEIYPQLQAGVWTQTAHAAGGLDEDPAEAIQTIHATWMIDYDLFRRKPSPAERAAALRAQSRMGYTFFCRSARVVQEDGTASVQLEVENQGGAPIYYAWQTEAEALDASGVVIARGQAAWPLPTLLPGKTAAWSIPFDTLPGNAQTILVRIRNPMPGGHDVAFANAEMGTVRKGWLTVTVHREPGEQSAPAE